MKNIIVLVLIIVFAFVFLSFKLTQVPPGINGDESGIGYNAILISRNLIDENENFLPLFIFAKGSDWKQPVSVYTTALVFKTLGPSFWALRATSILFVMVSIVLFYFLSKERFSLDFFIVGSLIFITVPVIMIQSHLALENIAVLPFIIFWLWKLSKQPTLGGISLGIGIFSYLGMRLIVPVLALVSLVYLRKDVKKVKGFLLGILPFFLLLYIANSYYPGAIVGHFSAPIPSVNEFLMRYLSIFDLSFLFLKGDSTPYHSTGRAGMFLTASLPIFLAGVYKIVREKKSFETLVLSSFLLSPVLLGFVPEIYRASRIVALVPLFVIISTVGFFTLTRNLKILTLFLMTVNAFIFAKDYWFYYPNRVMETFSIPIERTYEFRIKE